MLLRRIYNRLFGKKITRNSPIKDIIGFKENAWKNPRMSAYYKDSVEEAFFNAVTAELFTQGVSPNDKILDVGAGTGRLTFAFAKLGCEVLALDISPSMLSHIDSRKNQLKITTLEASAFKLPVENASYDVVASMDVDLHFPNWKEILAEKVRVCKPGGRIMFSALSKENTEHLNNPTAAGYGESDFFTRDYATFLTRTELEQTAAQFNLVIESVTPYNFLFLNSMLGQTLTREEASTFSQLYWKATKNPAFMEVIRAFEKNIVCKLPVASTVTNIVRLIKK